MGLWPMKFAQLLGWSAGSGNVLPVLETNTNEKLKTKVKNNCKTENKSKTKNFASSHSKIKRN